MLTDNRVDSLLCTWWFLFRTQGSSVVPFKGLVILVASYIEDNSIDVLITLSNHTWPIYRKSAPNILLVLGIQAVRIKLAAGQFDGFRIPWPHRQIVNLADLWRVASSEDYSATKPIKVMAAQSVVWWVHGVMSPAQMILSCHHHHHCGAANWWLLH